MNVQERRKKILDLLRSSSSLSVKELSKEFHVSIPTLYKDIDVLEKERQIQKRYGEIRLVTEDKYKHDFFEQLKIKKEEKQQIARTALGLISDGQTIFLDASSTTFYLCKELKQSRLENVTIVTNSVFIPPELLMSENFRVICIGGVLDRASAEFVSPNPELYLGNIHGNTFFFSVRALSPEKGVLDYYNPSDIRIKTMLYGNSDMAVCLADSTKFSKPGTVNWLSYENLHTVITDNGIPSGVLAQLKRKGVNVLY